MAPPGLRVIAGSVRGRRLVAPPGDDIRPTKGIVREAVFSALDSRGAIADAVVLDLYAGTGALGLEALSRGAEQAVLVERDRRALEAIEANVEHTGFADEARVVRSDVAAFLDGPPPPEAPFDLVFADPPYDVGAEAIAALVEHLGAPGWLSPGATLSIEGPVGSGILLPKSFRTGWERTFGDTLVVFVEASDAPA
jgi:16S rRNA (guanine966-N2)-methyltransferase